MHVSTKLLLLLFVNTVLCLKNDKAAKVISKIKAGFEVAGKFLGFDLENGLAQIVSETFGGKQQKHDDEKFNIFSGLLRLLGLDAKKIGAIAVNAIIFVAQLISSSLSRPVPSQLAQAKNLDEESPYEWIINNSNIVDILSSVNDNNLPDNVIEYIKERGLDEETGCLQLLVCKTAPLIWGMQKSINSTHSVPKGKAALFANIPSTEEFSDYGDACEEKHPYCIINY
ncbi:hypothetical protein FQA39_LY02006 [Lamprigera yunnana]|nr:hypothetical protein FQA39_LY02006 [Lamprigera yunnana]